MPLLAHIYLIGLALFGHPEASPQTSGDILINGRALDSSSEALIPAPIAGLQREGPYGVLPAPDLQGQKPYIAYARPYPQQANSRSVSIIISGLGLNSALTREAIYALPADISLAFAAHAPNLQSWIDQARATGHEVLLEIPMENESGSDNLPYTLSRKNSKYNQEYIQRHLAKAQGYFAILNYKGHRLMERSDALVPIFNQLASMGVGFIHDGSAQTPSLPILAQSVDLPFAQTHIILDKDRSRAAIQTQLNSLSSAEKDQPVLAIGFGFPETLRAVHDWVQNLPKNDLHLIPASSHLH